MSVTRSGLVTRLARGLGAHAILQASLLFIRVAEVPLFLYFWTAEEYGRWLMLAAIPAALSLADGGFTKTASREMAMKRARSDITGANYTFQCAWLMLLLLSFVVLLIVVAILWVAPIADLINVSEQISSEVSLSLFFLTLQVLVSFQSSLLYGALSSIGRHAQGTLLLALGFLLSFILSGLGASIDRGFVPVAMGGVVGASCGWLFMWTALRLHKTSLHFGVPINAPDEIKRLLRPSLASLAFPVGETINLQGMRLAVGFLFGPVALVAFTALRTLCRVALQPVLSIARTLEPEISMAYGARDEPRVTLLLEKGGSAAFLVSLTFCGLLALSADTLVQIWTGGKVQIDYGVFSLLLVSSFVSSLWCVPLAYICATNRHAKISSYYMLIYGIGCILSALAFSGQGLHGAAFSVLLVELAMMFVSLSFTARFAGTTPLDIVRHSTIPSRSDVFAVFSILRRRM